MASETRQWWCWAPGGERPPSPVWAPAPKAAAEGYAGEAVEVLSRGVDEGLGGRVYRTATGVRVVVEAREER